MRISWAASLLLAGCLAETVADGDRDGIPDSLDNCVDIANADQRDVDGDGIGDRCSPCARAVGYDLDDDGLDDGCDLCIEHGSSMDDVDADGLVDSCDPCIGVTGVFGGDRNGDGLDDGCTLCLGVVAPADGDGDGLDDACDRCASGPPHDEDGDGAEDGCDPCPLLATAAQTSDLDGDGRGDPCDGSEDPATVPLFEPFLTRNDAAWASGGDDWELANDRALASSNGTSVRLANAIMRLGRGYTVTAVMARAPLGPGASAGIHMAPLDGATHLRCVVHDDGAVTLELDLGGGATMTTTSSERIDVTQPIRLVLRRPLQADLGQQFICVADVPAGAVQAPGFAADDVAQQLHAGLEVAAGSVEFLAFEVVLDEL